MEKKSSALPLRGIQHVSRVCHDVSASVRFYADILGFTLIKRPSSFDFDGAWLFGYGIGIHLVHGQPIQRPSAIDPKADHLSFQCDSLAEVESRLKALDIEYAQTAVVEEGVRVTQIFFHDPDNNMIEVCNCDLLPIIPLSAAPPVACTACLNDVRMSTATASSNISSAGSGLDLSRSLSCSRANSGAMSRSLSLENFRALMPPQQALV